MSNHLDDSVGTELIADDEKSIHERMNNNTINIYKIKMKSDLQYRKHDSNYIGNNLYSQSSIPIGKKINND